MRLAAAEERAQQMAAESENFSSAARWVKRQPGPCLSNLASPGSVSYPVLDLRRPCHALISFAHSPFTPLARWPITTKTKSGGSCRHLWSAEQEL